MAHPISRPEYFKRNKYTFLMWAFSLAGLFIGLWEGIATLNPGRGLFAASCFWLIVGVIQLAGSIAYKRYVKAWYRQ